ncbi:hypothetical protein RGU12_05360 [Fredinandcohnia sp. QZ13]|uniref:hypothetical protein n=1 Tax=Fredinandcohnia sp. QZ13 TaxID=3073144 RepID=UPI0028532E97|nr:hypothetical protein [Fredinandcohnia sp. QZ13]MDR4886980.1 hypothetical protein [Fredinandcohnia sp. QZ13]
MKPRQQLGRQEDHIQLKQRIIHYQSEIVAYEHKLKSLQASIEKEKVRNQFLQEKLYSIEDQQLETYQKEIYELKEKLTKLEVELEEEKNRSTQLQQKVVSAKHPVESPKEKPVEAIANIQAYFAYSTLLPATEDDDLTIIGDFVIKNTGTKALHDMIVCIKLSPIDAGTLSGKIATKKSQTFIESDIDWVFLHENWKDKIKNNGEYWIKCVDPNPLQPNDTIVFPQFDISLPKNEEQHSVVVDGFVYSKELPKGTFSLNKIIVNY